MAELTDTDTRILDFERAWWKYAGAKEQAIRETFDWSATRYYQALNALTERPEALAHDSMLVRRRLRLPGRPTAGAPGTCPGILGVTIEAVRPGMPVSALRV